jgi:hypothetical protein
VAQVFSDVAAGGAYQFQYVYKAENLQPCAPAAVTPGDAQNGAVSNASCRTALGLADLYTFTTPAAGTLELDLSSLGDSGVIHFENLVKPWTRSWRTGCAYRRLGRRVHRGGGGRNSSMPAGTG